MWYLIVPPLIFLGSLWLLIVFLSRRAADPAVREELENTRAEGERRILFIKEETGLRILEKMTQRFKVSSLKLHNAFNSFSQSIKKRREVSEERKREREASIVEKPREEEEISRPSFWERLRGEKKESEPTVSSGETITENPVEERRGFLRFTRTPFRSSPSNGQGGVKKPFFLGEGMPILRRHREPKETVKRLMSEEDLIEKIAKNPKDALAYEELGDYYMETGNLEDAKACYRQVIKLLPLHRSVKEKVRKLERLLTQKGR